MDMRFFNRAFAICTAAALLAPAMYAQNPGGSAAEEENGLQRTADLVNLMRTVFDPNPSPVLVSPAERAVAGKTSAGSNAAVVKTVPVVIMPDIVIPESVADSGANADANTDADDPPCPAVTAARKKNTDGDDSESDDYPPYSYAFFFGDYVPYYRGWFYYSDRWIWGRRGAILFDPPGWIPPPPPPFDPFFPDIGPIPGPRPPIAGNGGSAPGKTTRAVSTSAQKTVSPKEPDGTIPVVPNLHRIPRKKETQVEPLERDTTIPVSPSLHRIPRKNETQVGPLERDPTIPVSPSLHRIPSKAASQILFPEKNTTIPVSPGAHRIPRKSDR